MTDQERIKLLEFKVENLMRRIVLLEARPIVGLGAGGPLVFDSTLIDAWDSLGGEYLELGVDVLSLLREET